ncbi:sugar phosphate isomerase/epimerase [Microbispora sp. RL4-1S]|uniref:Sugar phosphate isomerase/epimerase n=1 Tax=Microbispora oryzae TaxID=2806554 RepID=A0A941AH53_9ACTN|nr:sugar phosphate isomerase/epimerase [Microbispora oryzae]MBP2703706.1 sugar phosphate isomerase/epimerase [Microbispora oryzae]
MRIAHHMLTWLNWHSERDPLELDRMLEEIRETGYEGVELMELPVLPPAAIVKARLAAHDLVPAAFASLVPARPEDEERYRADMDYAAELGITTIMVCGGWLGEAGRRTTFDDDYARLAESLSAAIDHAARNGQIVAYHPHTGTIVETEEEIAMLLRHLPGLRLCVDTGHLLAVRSDPARVVRTYPGRVVHAHLKDWSRRDRFFAEIGQGDSGLDLTTFIGDLERDGYDGWLVVERDHPRVPPKESAALSYGHLRRIGVR